MKRIVKINPYYEPRMWGGGTRLRDEFHYVSNVEPLGEVYNVVALPNQCDCVIEEMNMTLSELYTQYPSWFECDTQQLPIRVNILDPMADLSVQLHPDDTFAKKYNGGRGKPEAWVILDTIDNGIIQFGHYAQTKEEFIHLTETKQWSKLLRYLPCEKDAFIDIPTGTLHAIGEGVLTYNISRNADLTLRLYDYDRIDPKTNQLREIHPQLVYDLVNIPDKLIEFQQIPYTIENNIKVTRYWDEPGLYTLLRLQTKSENEYQQERFGFYTCVKGEGAINGIQIIQGETLLVPDKMGVLTLKGEMDLFIASYRNK